MEKNKIKIMEKNDLKDRGIGSYEMNKLVQARKVARTAYDAL